PQGSVEHCVSRGLANISKSILLTRKIVKSGGVFYHMKGESWANEIADIPTQLCSIWSPALVKEYRLPVGEARFALVKTTKIS
ncbi:MAG: class I SAM-dependent methyltransferase, partial [Bdellovibrionaceae bacterium]|nr:class I SAM-dependent methyltransferase [Pseudobdellovibrionaceae bacterium]